MATSRPNILILHADQQRFDTIAALGNSHVRTPNLDRLVQQGRAYLNGYSSCPVCMPARHDLLTGASAKHHGYWCNSNNFIASHALDTFPRLLTKAGYQTIAVGKMHHNPPREHHGWAHMFLMEELPHRREDDAYLEYLDRVGYGHIRCQHGVRPLFYHTPQPSRVPEEHHGSAWVAHKTIELLREERDVPFCIMTSWVGPHPPYYVPESYLAEYRDADLPGPCPLPESGDRQFAPSPENPEPGSLRAQRLREAYFAACTLIDTHIGRILDALEETGQAENTLVFFMSDHGEMLGDRQGYQKHFPYEGSAHIPYVVRGPGFAPGSRSACPVNTWDVTATVLDAAGINVPAEHPLAGTSLYREAEMAADRVVHFHHGNGRTRYVAAVGSGHKFVHFYNGGEEELYDMAADPWEQHNLLADGASSPMAATLRAATLAFEAEFGQTERVKDGAFVDFPYAAPGRHAASFYPPWSYKQYPPWMVGYSAEDRAAILDEMRDSLKEETAYICLEPEWRADAIATWEGLGGNGEELQAIFDAVDAKA
jgi:arylsulfatase A-like enzyme